MTISPTDTSIGLPAPMPGMDKKPPELSAEAKKKDRPLGAKKKAADKEATLSKMRKRFERCVSTESENRKAALDDLKFKAGDQWPADVIAARRADNRPILTFNKIPTFIHQVTNEQRQERPSIVISPNGDRSDVEVAKMLRGLIRDIERQSNADIAYDTAFDGAVSNGFGYFRLLTRYEQPDSFDQAIRIERIRNPFTVYLDPDSQEPDGCDARFGFVTEMVPRDEFEALYPKCDPMSFPLTGTGEALKDWADKDNIRVVEYFDIAHEKRELIGLSNGATIWEDEMSPDVKALIDNGTITIENRRTSDLPKVKWYKATAKDIVEEKDWLGQWIPIFKVIGDEVDVEGKVKLSGVIRHAKDAQRMYNYFRTMETELVALAPKAPFIMEEGQVEGHEGAWKSANVKNNPYLLYKGTNIGGKPAPPPQRQQFAGIPAGVVQAGQNAAQDMMATTGIRFDATLQERMHDESGRAIRELRRSGDITNMHYIDNLSRTLKHLGRCLIDLIPKIYDTKRIATILREDDKEEIVEIDPTSPKPMMEKRDPQTGKIRRIFNPNIGKYGVTVSIGPSYATRRIEASESMMDFVKAMPNTAALVSDLIAKYQDWPGAEEMAARLAKAVPAQYMQPAMKDVPPQVQAVMQAMEQQIKMLSAELQKAMLALSEKNTDRQIQMDKINKDFEAKLIAVVQKAESSFNTHLAGELKAIGESVNVLREALTQGEQPTDRTDADSSGPISGE